MKKFESFVNNFCVYVFLNPCKISLDNLLSKGVSKNFKLISIQKLI